MGIRSHKDGIAAGLGMVLAAMTSPLHLAGQVPAAPAAEKTGPGARVLLSSGRLTSVSGRAPGQLIREIDDPFNGARWLLVRDSEYPAGPARLLLVESGQVAMQQRGQVSAVGPASPRSELASLRPVIRPGDRLVVEENTAVVESRLEAVALGSAVAGGSLEVRLRVGGRVVRAVALAPGRAEFASMVEGRP
jgi:hypothetical protein